MGELASIAATIPLLLDGLAITVAICALASAFAIVLAVPLVAARGSARRAVRGAATGYVTVIRGLPIVVLIFLLYFGMPALFGLERLSAFWIGVLALTMNGAAFISEVLRGALARVPAGQYEAARTLGLGRLTTWRLVMVPQLLPIALPALVGEIGFLVKASPALSLITVVDLTRRAQQVTMQTFDPLLPLIAAAILYFLLLGTLSLLSRGLEVRLERGMVAR